MAQLLLKKGSFSLDKIFAGESPFFMKLINLLIHPSIVVAAALLATGMFLWIKVLSRAELSQAYPIVIALTVITTSVASAILFGESFTWLKFGGIALIVVGLWGVLAS